MSAVDRYNPSSRNLSVNFVPVPRKRCNLCRKVSSYFSEILSRFSYQSLRSALYIAANNDFSRRFLSGWKRGSFITDFPTPRGTIYLTADPLIMHKVFNEHRKDDTGLFYETENTNLFVAGILKELFPKEVAKIGIERVAEMFILTTSQPHVADLRGPYMKSIGAKSIEDRMQELTDITNEMLAQLTSQEQNECNSAALSFEYAATVISRVFTHWGKKREDYQRIAGAMNLISQRMTKMVLSKPLTTEEKTQYDKAVKVILALLNECLSNPSPFVQGLKNSMDGFQIKVFLFALYFAGTETTASIINYLLWQLGRKENHAFQQEIREKGANALERCIAEAIRLHPPAAFMGRRVREDVLMQVRSKLSNNVVFEKELRGGHNFLCLSQAAGLDPELYPNPYKFNPDRFKDPQISALSTSPFAGGPHFCPGRYLALAEIRILLQCLLSSFNIETLSPDAQTQKGTFTLRALPAMIRLKPLNLS